MRHVRRGGPYLRVADPGWADPLSGAWSEARGGRWNAPGGFEVVYLNRTPEVARAQVMRHLAPLAIYPEELDPVAAPVLVATEVPEDSYVDAMSEAGLRSLGLPETYPLDSSGAQVGHARCQPLGEAAKAAEERGIATRSAAADPSPGEELAYFGEAALEPTARRGFAEWFWPGTGAG
jgi:RES domain-containing protein